MAISKPFAYNPGGPISGTTQYGDIVVGNIVVDYSSDYGGIKWWGGPDEELGYVVGNARPGGQPVPAGVTGPAYVGFWRSQLLTDNSFLSLANYIGAQNSEPPFATTSDAVTWLNNNGYYTSYVAQLINYYIGGFFTLSDFLVANRTISLNTDGSKDTTFNIGDGFNNVVYSTSIQSDGKIIVGGNFTTFTGSTQNRLIRLNSDGSKDTSFNIGSGFNNLVYSTSIQSDGKILIGGNFTTFTGSSQNYLIRLNSDGSKDSTFNIGTGFNSIVYSISIQTDGKIIVGGNFTTFTGSTQDRLIRLNSDGSKDTSFEIGYGFDNVVYSTSIQTDGKIIVGGNFGAFSGISQNKLVRLNSDGSKDTTFNIGSGFNARIFSTSIQTDGKIIAGGQFATFTGSSQNYLIRLNSDGSKDTSFDIGSGFDNDVYSTSIQSDGKLLLGGFFTTFTGSSQNRLIRLNSNGSKDTSFNIGTGFDGDIRSTSIQPDGKIIVVGSFTTFSGVTQNRLLKCDSNYSLNTSFNIGTGFNDSVECIAIQSNGKILVGGRFTTFTGSSQNRLIRLNSDGSKDTSFDIGSGFNTTVRTIAFQSDGKILVGGNFTTFTGSSQNYLIRLNSDGSKDTTFNIGDGFNSIVYSISIQTDGKILVGGNFQLFSVFSPNYFIRLNSDGSKDTSFDIGSGFNSIVYSTSIQSDGKIIVGGNFTTFTGSSQNRLIRLNSDGSKDSTFNIGIGFGNTVYSTSIQSDGKILVGGNFSSFSGSTQNSLIRLNSNGSKDSTFDIGTGFNSIVYSISIQTDGKILVGGAFTTYQGVSSLRNILLNSDGSVSNNQLSLNNTVNSVAIQQ